jgi:cytosine/adenosine deaminase-related metal-dependent hydrolase
VIRKLAWLALGIAAASIVLLASALRPPRLAVPERGVVLPDVTVVRPGEGRSRHQTVVVRGARIDRIRDATPGERRAQGVAYVLPGLIDLHVHHPPGWALAERELFALLFLAHGVTTVRDTGSVLTSLAGHQRRIAEGELAGPRVFRCGPVLDGEPPSWPGARVVASPADAGPVVAELAADGVDCIKLYNHLAPDVTAALLRAAAARELPVVAHVPFRSSLAALDGAEVQHLMGLTTQWWTVTPERIAWYVSTSRAHGISHTPTLEAFDRQARIGEDAAASDFPAARLLPRYYRELLWDPARNPIALAVSPAGGSTIPARVPVMKRVVLALHEAGVPIRVGSDAGNLYVVPGAGLQAEMRQLVDAGLDPERVWALATRGNGEALGRDGLGQLREGAPADLLLFRRDPLRDLDALDSLSQVVADGRPYSRADLDAAVAAWRSHFQGRVYDSLSELAARAVLWVATRP